MFYKYPVSALGFDMLNIDGYEVGWARRIMRDELVGKSWQQVLLQQWASEGIFKNLGKGHVLYIFKTLVAQGIHIYDGDHPFGWGWDYCTHPNRTCEVCDYLLIISHAERVNKYGEITALA